jgi:hypothetical protein
MAFNGRKKMSTYQHLNLQKLSDSITSIRLVVRRQVHLPRVISTIRYVKRKHKKDAAEPTPLETADDRFRRLQDAVTNIRSQCRRNRLPITISHIRQTINRNFELEERAQYQLLLNAFKGGGLPLASLSICGQGTREIRYTQLLRYFFDPNELHGLGRLPGRPLNYKFLC